MKCYNCKKEVTPEPIQGNTNLRLNTVDAIGRQMNFGVFDSPIFVEKMSIQNRSSKLRKMIRSSSIKNKNSIKRHIGKLHFSVLIKRKSIRKNDNQKKNIGRCPNCHVILSW